MVSEKFLIDANILITPYKTFYPFDFAPSFWNQLSTKLGLDSVAILDVAKEEVEKGDDELSEWMRGLNGIEVINKATIITKYAEVINHVSTSPFYNDKALREWSRDEVADPWLIAAAATYGYTIITFERGLGSLNASQPSGRPKIPDVGQAFGVQCQDLYYFMRKMGFSL